MVMGNMTDVTLPGYVTEGSSGKIWTYPAYDENDRSSDYQVTLRQGDGEEVDSFTFFSQMADTYYKYEVDNTVSKVFDMTTHSKKQNTIKNSTSVFSFAGEPVTVRVKVLPCAEYITLPLSSAKVLPTSKGIECHIEDGDTIVFELKRPEKVFVVPNYDLAWELFEKIGKCHTPVQSWKQFKEQGEDNENYYGHHRLLKITEGYKNPLVLTAHAPEDDKWIPDPESKDTLVVYPEDKVCTEDLLSYKYIWFKPGIHDLSKLDEDPNQCITLCGQHLYLEGGSYVMARFCDSAKSGSVYGRGIMSGRNHKWTENHWLYPLLNYFFRIEGIVFTDRSGYSMQHTREVRDITAVGAWHYNTDVTDVNDGVVEDVLAMAMDDCIKVERDGLARKLVLWQNCNAHAVMIQENANVDFANTMVEDVDVVFTAKVTWNNKWHLNNDAAIGCLRGAHSLVSNFLFKDIRIEAPYVSRIFTVYSLDTSKTNPGWFQPTSEERHTVFDGLTFENIQVTTPVILVNSLIGSEYEKSLKNITLKDFVVQGTKVTDENYEQFVELDGDVENFVVLK